MRIKFRLEKVKKYHGSSGYSPMSHLWGHLGPTHVRSVYVVNKAAPRHTFFSQYFGFPSQYHSTNTPYSLHADATLNQEKHMIKKKFYQTASFLVFVYHTSPVATVCTITFYIQKSYILPTESSLCCMTHTNNIPFTQCVRSVFTARCELHQYMQC